MSKYYISNIKWDTDGEIVELPTELEIELDIDEDDNIDDILSDYLSDTYGWCHFGFEYKEVTAMKKKVKVTIEECISQTFEVDVEAANDDEAVEKAMEIAEEKYNFCEFVLDNANVSAKQMTAECGNVVTEWIEF